MFRLGAIPEIDGEVEARLAALAWGGRPEGRARWTLSLLAAELVSLELVDSISRVAAGRALRRTRSSRGK